MRRPTVMVIVLASVLLLAAVASAVPREARDDCDRACHQRLRAACADDPSVSDHCERSAASDRDARLRAYCAEHADEARCQPHGDVHAQRLRAYCAEHPDDARCERASDRPSDRRSDRPSDRP